MPIQAPNACTLVRGAELYQTALNDSIVRCQLPEAQSRASRPDSYWHEKAQRRALTLDDRLSKGRRHPRHAMQTQSSSI